MQIETMIRQGKKFVVLPEQEFNALVKNAEMLADVRAYDAIKAAIESGAEELIPFSIVTRRVAGESPVKIWREHRKLTQEALSAASGVSRGMIAAVESGHKQAGIGSLKKLAKALGCEIENLA